MLSCYSSDRLTRKGSEMMHHKPMLTSAVGLVCGVLFAAILGLPPACGGEPDAKGSSQKAHEELKKSILAALPGSYVYYLPDGLCSVAPHKENPDQLWVTNEKGDTALFQVDERTPYKFKVVEPGGGWGATVFFTVHVEPTGVVLTFSTKSQWVSTRR